MLEDRSARLLIVALLVLAGAIAPARGQNLLPNGDFDVEVEPWFNFSEANGTSTWNDVDMDGDPNSGSLLVTNTSMNPGANGAGAGLFGTPVTSLAYYSFGVSILIAPGQPVGADVTMELQFFSGLSGDCSGFLMNWFTPPVRVAPTRTTASRIARAPEGATCIRVYLETYPDSVGQTFQARFDGAFLIEALFVDGFEFGDTGGWSSSVP